MTQDRPGGGCRLSRVKAATTSPERQREGALEAAASVGAHIIDWADDWEVPGATDPMTPYRHPTPWRSAFHDDDAGQGNGWGFYRLEGCQGGP
ncbi:hypothetical protein [Streptomyces lunalinharesii]|uniref:Uncharacterized protein n=1 Tax=Streptomyces lunalinharesii TaxID=333384 RepID=A0ABN3R635_9ACTN